MWIHVTWLGVLQSTLGVALVFASLVTWFVWVWFLHGMSPDQRRTGDWLAHLGLTAIVLVLGALYAWWVFL